MRELTPMQAACWFGRSSETILAGVSAHLYSEFDGQDIDLIKLNRAIKQLYQRHDMLRLKLSSDGIPSIISANQDVKVEVDDFSKLTKSQQRQQLEQKRQHWTHQKLDLTQAQTARFSVSLLADQQFRLHIDTDMIPIDPSSFRILIEDLAIFYDDAEASLPQTADFFVWKSQLKQDPHCQQQRKRDRLWWKSGLADIAPAPSIPLKSQNGSAAQSHRLSTTLNAMQRQALQTIAKRHQLTFSALLMGLFAYCLGKMTKDQAYRLNVPMFWREPVTPRIEQTIGDFANVLILNVDMSAGDNLAQFCQRLSQQLTQSLGHYQYSGVQIMRDLSRQHGSAQIAPVVFTAAVDFQQGELFSERVHRIFGEMNWAISQGPQVALDVQVVNVAAELLINWDIRLDALAESWINRLFESYSTLLQAIAANADTLEQALHSLPLEQLPSETIDKNQASVALNALQTAYLLGRSHAFALGGVAMQECREYAGPLELKAFKQHLAEMVQRHPSLRTYIDEKKLVQYVSDEVIVNLTEIDLLALDQTAANTQIAAFRADYQHALFDLNQPPWNITLFKLNHNQFHIFVRFDALILDGRSIASLMVELFSAQSIAQANQDPAAKPIADQAQAQAQAQARIDDQRYWQHQLAENSHVPKLPWRKPLNQILTSRYRRQSLSIDQAQFQHFCKLGARQGLFKNSLIMALLLELLAQHTTDQNLTAGVPVLPLYSSSFSNQSSFIVTTWQQGTEFVTQAKQLQKNVLEALQHLAFSGVDLARMLFEKHQFAPALPVIITNGLSWPTLAESNPIKYINGLTQTPQVAIDIRFRLQNDHALIFDIDYAQAAISDQFIRDFLVKLEQRIEKILALGLEHAELKACSEHVQQQISEQYADSTIAAQDATNISNQQNLSREQILQIYLQHLNISSAQIDHTEMPFSEMGLRLSHLKAIAQQLNQSYSIKLSALQLAHCQNVLDVEKLILSKT